MSMQQSGQAETIRQGYQTLRYVQADSINLRPAWGRESAEMEEVDVGPVFEGSKQVRGVAADATIL